MAIQKIELIWISVADLKKSINFFTNTLGLQVHQLSEEFGWAELIGKDGGCLLGVAQSQTGDTHVKTTETNAVVAFTVDNIDTTITELKKADVIFVDELMEVPNGPRMISFTDLDGNLFQLVEPGEMERKN